MVRESPPYPEPLHTQNFDLLLSYLLSVQRALAGVFGIISAACGAAFLVQSGETYVPLVMCRCSTYGEKMTSLRQII